MATGAYRTYQLRSIPAELWEAVEKVSKRLSITRRMFMLQAIQNELIRIVQARAICEMEQDYEEHTDIRT